MPVDLDFAFRTTGAPQAVMRVATAGTGEPIIVAAARAGIVGAVVVAAVVMALSFFLQTGG